MVNEAKGHPLRVTTCKHPPSARLWFNDINNPLDFTMTTTTTDLSWDDLKAMIAGLAE
ncbi:MAG: hypothetical protein K6360_06435 [Deltaproteobacteria bacterium]